MNLLPITVTKNLNSPGASGGNALSGSKNTEQASEFTGILSESLVQQNPQEATTAPSDQSLAQLPHPISSGQELPQAGESLPPAILSAGIQGSITEDDVSATLTLESVETATNPEAVTLALDENVMPLSSELLAGITVEGPGNPLTMASAGVLHENGIMNQESTRAQLNSLTRQATPGIALSTQAATPLQNMNNPAQTSTGENSLTGQSQSLPIPELTSATIDDKPDFSRIIEKGLLQLNKESLSGQIVPTTESTTRSNLESLKTATDSLQLQQSIDKPKWSQEFGSRLVWLTKEGVQSAQLKLTPAHLGTIEVKISIQNDQANVSFISQNGAVRDAIESSLPRLREMMQEAGVKLEQANVATNTNANAQHNSPQSDKTPGQESHANGFTDADEAALSISSPISVGHEGVLSGIDFYA